MMYHRSSGTMYTARKSISSAVYAAVHPRALMLYRFSPTYRVDFTCTRHKGFSEPTTRSYRSLSPQGFATLRPRLVALFRNAASACSPNRLRVQEEAQISPTHP